MKKRIKVGCRDTKRKKGKEMEGDERKQMYMERNKKKGKVTGSGQLRVMER